MYQSHTFEVEGVAPLILHNGRLANPLDPFTKSLRELSVKRKKTDADLEELSRREWFGGLYTDEQNRPCIPGENIEAMLVNALKKQRLGSAGKAGVIVDGSFPIRYEGPQFATEDLYRDGRFVDRRMVKIQKIKVLRTRPIFRNWKLEFTVNFLPEILNKAQVVDAVVTAGRLVGLGDFVPKFGRFEVVKQ